MTKEDFINKIWAEFDNMETINADLASIEAPYPTYNELTTTVENQGFDFLLNNSTSTVTDRLTYNMKLLRNAYTQASNLLTLIVDASMEYDKPEHYEAKKDIIQRYTDYMDSLD